MSKHTSKATALLLLLALPLHASTWTGVHPDNNNWSQGFEINNPADPSDDEPSNWTTADPPGEFTDVIVGPPSPSQVDGSFPIATLEVTPNGVVELLPGSSVSIGGGALINHGHITVWTPGSPFGAHLSFGSDAQLTGAGEVLLNLTFNFINAANLSTAPGATLTQAAEHKIRGGGRINAALVNNGVVEAADLDNEDNVILWMVGNDKTNNHIMRATNGATLDIASVTVTQHNQTGRIIAEDGGTVEVNVDGTAGAPRGKIVGGVIETAGTGVIRSFGAEFKDVTINGNLQTEIGDSTVFSGSTLTNNGTIRFFQSGNASRVHFADSLALNGSGRLVMHTASVVAGQGSFLSGSTGVTVTQGAGHTIEGAGRIQLPINNHGIISANVAGDVLHVGGDLMNNHLTKAAEGGDLLIDGIVLTNGPGGRIVADDGSLVRFAGSTVTDGVFQTVGTGTINGSDATLHDATNEGTFTVESTNATIKGTTLTNTGTLTVNPQASFFVSPSLEFDDHVVLQGTGEVVLGRTDKALITTTVGNVVTQAAGHSIRGAGGIHAELVNNGLVEAVTNRLTLTASPKTNHGILQAASDSVLRIENVDVMQSGAGRIIAQTGGAVELGEGAHIMGGTLQTNGTGVIEGTLQGAAGATLESVSNQGTINVTHAGALTMAGADLANEGTINVNPLAGFFGSRTLDFVDDSTLSGLGEIVLGRWDRASINVSVDKTLIHTGQHTIRGTGRINGDVVNLGRIEGNGAANSEAIHIDGVLSGDGSLANVIIHGAHSPGLSPAIVPLDGNYKLEGLLEMEIGGPDPGTGYDQLASTGSIDLGTGTIDIDVIDGYVPPIGSEFIFMIAAGGVMGAPTVNVPMIDGEPVFDVSFGIDFGTVTTVRTIPEAQFSLTVFGCVCCAAACWVRRTA